MASSERSPLLTNSSPPSSGQQRKTSTNRDDEDAEEEAAQKTWISNLVASVKIAPRNQGLLFVLAAEIVGASMDATVRFVQQSQGRTGFPLFEVIFFRMSITLLLSTIYSWWTKIPDFPLGPSKVRGLLFARALFGSSGLVCLYYSIHFITVTESTVVRFLVPLATTALCSILLSQAFTLRDLIAGILSITGVVIMAHPAAIFGSESPHPTTLSSAPQIDPVTPAQHILALSVSVLGVFFAASAYTTIRLIGHSTHALISVSYFSALSTTFTVFIFLLHPTPDTTFILPSSIQDWILLIGLGIAGFILQFLLTKGLQMDKSSRATSMLYLQIVFAAILDWGVWGVLPGLWSWVGGGVVVGSTLWLALAKSEEGSGDRVRGGDEETLIEEDEDESEDGIERSGVISEAVIARRASVSSGI